MKQISRLVVVFKIQIICFVVLEHAFTELFCELHMKQLSCNDKR